MSHQAHKSDHARFLRDWQGFIDRWVTKVVVRRGGGTAADADDVRQSAYMEAYAGYVKWQRLPAAERTGASVEAVVGRHVKDAVVEEWSRLRGVPRNSHARGAGVRAAILGASLCELTRVDRPMSAASRVNVQAHSVVAYHLLMEGLVHGSQGLVRPDTKLLRAEVVDRIHFAIDRLENEHPDAHRLIVGYYFEGRTFKALGEEMGIRSSSKLHRLHLAGLRVLRDEMIEFASVLSARNVGHTLEDGPTGDAPT